MPDTKKQKTSTQLPPFGNPYYPPAISDKKVTHYLKDENKPINILNKKENKVPEKAGEAVVHLFTNDLRVNDNVGLSKASDLKSKFKVPLIGLFVLCTERLYSHTTSPFQLKFKMETLKILAKDLKDLNIPLVVLQVDKAKNYVPEISKFMAAKKAKILTGNINYEVDELRDYIKLHDCKDFSFNSFHDTCTVAPGELKSGKGTPYSVFSPWWKAWVTYVNSNPPEVKDPPIKNEKAPKVEEFKLPEIPKDKTLSSDKLKAFEKLYNPGEKPARDRLLEYVKLTEITEYDDLRNDLSADVASHLSPYLAIGCISPRTIVQEVLNSKSKGKKATVDSGNQSVVQWTRQVAWRDFYKHVLANWPHLSMYRPFHLELSDIKWENEKDLWDAWCNGQTGYPVVDACMRQLNQTGDLSNRGRMIVASFLAKHLLIDWRYGERFFSENLIDFDMASNNGGWGFSSSAGVDPQPYFRIFNPYLQSLRFDPDGNFIRKWVDELKDVKGKQIHQPYENDSQSINDYPMPIVEHKFARQRALDRYNEARY